LLIRNKNIKLILNYIIGPLVFCILVYAIYQQIQQQTDWQRSIYRVLDVFRTGNAWKLIAVFLLMFLNWGIEARKWQLALAPVTNISFFTSFKAIFSGTTMAFFTPNRMGEYMGRILHVEERQRISSIALTIVCSMAQLMITLVAGTGGLLFVISTMKTALPDSNVIFWINLLLYIVSACLLVLTIFYFRVSWLIKWVEKIPRIERILNYIRVLDKFNATLLVWILSLSFTRYLVFIVQYFLLFSVFGVDLGWWQTFWSVSVVFLVIAIVPSIAALTELGVRWKTSIEVLHLFSQNTAGILATSLAAWIINLVIPALLGSLLIFGLKFFRNT
jgi:uncharacterized membrane protein YbhN (UPF0104 family)